MRIAFAQSRDFQEAAPSRRTWETRRQSVDFIDFWLKDRGGHCACKERTQCDQSYHVVHLWPAWEC
jgi:hypothetical protein